MASAKSKFNVNAAEFDPTSVSAAVAGLGASAVCHESEDKNTKRAIRMVRSGHLAKTEGPTV